MSLGVCWKSASGYRRLRQFIHSRHSGGGCVVFSAFHCQGERKTLWLFARVRFPSRSMDYFGPDRT